MTTRRTTRLATTSLAALLALGGTTAATAIAAGAQTTDPPTTIAPDPGTPISLVATIHLPMIGDLTVTLDASGAISEVTFVPVDGVVGTTTVVERDIQLDVTYADGTTQTILLETHVRNGEVRIEVEDDEQGDDDHGDDNDTGDDHTGPPAIEDRGVSIDHRQDDQGHNGHGEGVSDPTTPTTDPTAGAPVDQGGYGDDDTHGGSSHSGSEGRD